MQWAAIFHKHDVRITKGIDNLIFYNIFYGMRIIDIKDDLPKWSGHKNHSELYIMG
ncbi:MAG: hypothetical protein GY699_10270 [Desulfobacteraceae bacterium]|nr:hypothetical protein [Desulfobacteraceae bacterium]